MRFGEDRRAASDAELVRRALAGDRAAGEELARRLSCVPRTLAVLNRRMGTALSRHDLEDLAQDTLMEIWGKLPRFRGPAGLERWCYRFCFGTYMNRLRAKGLRDGLVARDPGDADREPAAAAAPRRAGDDLERALMELGPDQAEVVMLKHFAALTFVEIGRELGIPPSTAKTLYYRGLGRLRERLAPASGGRGS